MSWNDDRVEQVRSTKTAREKARRPRVKEIRFEGRSDFYFSAQTRLAEAFARRDATEPHPMRRAQTHLVGLTNVLWAIVARCGEDEALDDALVELSKAGVGANAVQDPLDRVVLGEAARDLCRAILASPLAPEEDGPVA